MFFEVILRVSPSSRLVASEQPEQASDVVSEAGDVLGDDQISSSLMA